MVLFNIVNRKEKQSKNYIKIEEKNVSKTVSKLKQANLN